MVFSVKQSVNMVLMILVGSFCVHLLVVKEEVRVYSTQEPLLPCYCLLKENERGACDPVNECTRWPLVCEWQMKELQHLEKRSESVDEPMLIIFRYTSLK